MLKNIASHTGSQGRSGKKKKLSSDAKAVSLHDIQCRDQRE